MEKDDMEMRTKNPFHANQGHPARTTSAARSVAGGTAMKCESLKWSLPSKDDPFGREFAPFPKAPHFDPRAIGYPRTLTCVLARRVAPAPSRLPNTTAKKCWPK